MRILNWSFIAVLSLSAATAAIAQTVEPGNEGELANFLKPQPGARICYARTYSADHLKAHPKQKVEEIRFDLTYYRHDPDDFFKDGQRNYYFRLRARVRGEKQWGEAFGDCSPEDDAISCGVECDGGGVFVKRRDGNQALVYFGDSQYIRLAGCDGGDESTTNELTPGADDKEFLLTETAEADCPVYEDW